MQQWWEATDKGQLKYWEKNLSPCPSVHEGALLILFNRGRGGRGTRCKFRLGQIPIQYFTVGHDHCPIRRLRHNNVIQYSIVKQANVTYIKYEKNLLHKFLACIMSNTTSQFNPVNHNGQCKHTRTAFLKLFSSGDHFHQSECSTDHPNLGIIKLIRPALNSVRNMFLQQKIPLLLLRVEQVGQ